MTQKNRYGRRGDRRAARFVPLLAALWAAGLAAETAAQTQDKAQDQKPERKLDRKLDRFTRLDANRDGVLTVSDMVTVGERRTRRMDRDGDGAISRAEFMAYQGQRAARRVDRLFRRLDPAGSGRIPVAKLPPRIARRAVAAGADPNGTLSRAAVMAAYRARAQFWQDRIFRRFDRNGDGRIDRAERMALTEIRFRRLDANGDGRVSREEFDAALARWRKRRNK